MLVPIEWLNDYIDLKDIDTEEFCDRICLRIGRYEHRSLVRVDDKAGL